MKIIEKVPSINSLGGDEFEGSKEYIELAKKFNEVYYHWDELKYKVDDEETRKKVWIIMKLTRLINSRYMDIGGISCSFSLTSNLLEKLFTLEKTLSGYIEHRGKEIGNGMMRYHSVSAFLEEAISSSILEGAAVTRRDAKNIIRKSKKPITNGEKMVMNNYLAMENIKRHLDEKLTPELIKEMHQVIVADTLKAGEEWEGRFREDNETVVGDNYELEKVFHVPPSFDKIPKMIEGLCEFANADGGEYIHPIVKGVIIHFLIGFIHPFVDGNGRLARSLFYWHVMKKGYPVMEYTAISKIIKKSSGRYGLAYQYAETDENDLTYFINFNVDCTLKAVKELEEYVDGKFREQRKALDFVNRHPGLKPREATILNDYMSEDSPFSIREIERRYGVAYQTAREYVQHLEELGLVDPIGKERKKVLYALNRDNILQYAKPHSAEKTKNDLTGMPPMKKDPRQQKLF